MKTINKPKELTLERVLNAAPNVVFDAWTDEKKLAVWWGPKGFTNPVCTMDLRVNGDLFIEMTGPDGTAYPMIGRFQEITAPGDKTQGKLIFLAMPLDDNNKPLMEVLNSIAFISENGKTRLQVHALVVIETDAAVQYLEGMENGWNESLVRLENFLMKL